MFSVIIFFKESFLMGVFKDGFLLSGRGGYPPPLLVVRPLKKTLFFMCVFPKYVLSKNYVYSFTTTQKENYEQRMIYLTFITNSSFAF